ncbi:MAG: HindIII family type II restriction endonuclease [Syntrophomonadaceae bacterium]|jgi:type II restriction enzyme|nr:HindIII family type II restriction endonuclease [Syntrophomonadaceae bacterium]
MFNKLIALIAEYAHDGFFDATKKLNEFISTTDAFLELVSQIGIIPESIAYDSTEEKLFAKASDAVLSRAFRELGLKSTVLSERADAADVMAQSRIFDYTLVADAKAFRMSRTAKNQKDFKVGALSGWRNDNDYAVLCSPYFQYPRSQSQIYAQAIDNNVCLLSWEHFIFLLTHGIKESENINLSSLWNFGEAFSHNVVVAEKKKCFVSEFDTLLLSTAGQPQSEFDKALAVCVKNITQRGKAEKAYWEEERKAIAAYTREQAVSELIKSKKIDEKIRQIESYIRGISRD